MTSWDGRLPLQILSTSSRNNSSRRCARCNLASRLTKPTSSVIVVCSAIRSLLNGACSARFDRPSARHSGRSKLSSLAVIFCMTCSAHRCEKTTASRRLFEANRLAPCNPVQAVSPIAYRPGYCNSLEQVGHCRARPFSSTDIPPTM